MNTVWDKFIEVHKGEFLAREIFDEMCFELLNKHFPGRKVTMSDKIQEAETDKLNVIFHSKLYTDEITNSRKGQIRKTFKNFIKFKLKKDFKVYGWVFCVAKRLSDNEMKWWISWKTKMSKQYSIDIQLFDGDKLIELTRKYNLYNRFFNPHEENSIDNNINEDKKETIPFKLLDDDFEINFIINDKNSQNHGHSKTQAKTKETEQHEHNEYHEHSEEQAKTEETEQHEHNEYHEHSEEQAKTKETEHNEHDKNNEHREHSEEQAKTEETEQHEHKKEFNKANKDKESKQLENKNNIITGEVVEQHQENISIQKSNFDFKFEKYATKYNELKKKINKLTTDEEDKSRFNEIIDSDWNNYFNVNKKEISSNVVQLCYIAKTYLGENKYANAMCYYEAILKHENHEAVLGNKKTEILNPLKDCQENISIFLKELEGAICIFTGDNKRAYLYYKDCYDFDNNNEKYARYFYEISGDLELESENYKDAKNLYNKALDNAKDNETLNNKYQNAKYLNKARKNFILSPLYYITANNYIQSEKTEKKIKESSKLFFYTIAIITIFLMLVFFIIFKANNIPLQSSTSNTAPQSTTTQTTSTPQPPSTTLKLISGGEQAMAEGDAIVASYTHRNIHLLDTAIFAYKRALNFSSLNNELNQKIKTANQLIVRYITEAQHNIKQDPSNYFVSMRHPSEGLKLFKYTYNQSDKSQGKYGYVDTNMNIIIPPIYDFDYQNMYGGNENFKNGKAFVCLIWTNGEHHYYYINKNNKLISYLSKDGKIRPINNKKIKRLF